MVFNETTNCDFILLSKQGRTQAGPRRKGKFSSIDRLEQNNNRECLKFDKIGKHSSSTKIIIVNIYYQCIISGKSTTGNLHQNKSH